MGFSSSAFLLNTTMVAILQCKPMEFYFILGFLFISIIYVFF
jgi:hypothetical protein